MLSGDLRRLISEKPVVGVITNPTIFTPALARGTVYDQHIHAVAACGTSVEQAVREILVADVQHACDMLDGRGRSPPESTGGLARGHATDGS
jgi:transaldolase